MNKLIMTLTVIVKIIVFPLWLMIATFFFVVAVGFMSDYKTWKEMIFDPYFSKIK